MPGVNRGFPKCHRQEDDQEQQHELRHCCCLTDAGKIPRPLQTCEPTFIEKQMRTDCHSFSLVYVCNVVVVKGFFDFLLWRLLVSRHFHFNENKPFLFIGVVLQEKVGKFL